jgi:fumarate reductase subunit D
MEFPLSPGLSGLIGGAIAYWLAKKFAHQVPGNFNGKNAKRLVEENRWRILGANTAFFGTILVCLALFKTETIPSTDARIGGLVFGSVLLAPVIFLLGTSLFSGRHRIAEAFVAYAISQKTPLWILYGMCGLGAAVFAAALFAMLRAV